MKRDGLHVSYVWNGSDTSNPHLLMIESRRVAQPGSAEHQPAEASSTSALPSGRSPADHGLSAATVMPSGRVRLREAP
jgi:hypothetical protein